MDFCVWREVGIQVPVFPCRYPAVPTPFAEKTFLSPRAPLSRTNRPRMCESVSGLSFLSHWPAPLPFCRHHTAVVTAALGEGFRACRLFFCVSSGARLAHIPACPIGQNCVKCPFPTHRGNLPHQDLPGRGEKDHPPSRHLEEEQAPESESWGRARLSRKRGPGRGVGAFRVRRQKDLPKWNF